MHRRACMIIGPTPPPVPVFLGTQHTRDAPASLASLEEALREAVEVAVRAASSSSSSSQLSAGGAGAGAAGSAGSKASRLGYAVLAAAAEDVAVQIACAVMAARLARGQVGAAGEVWCLLNARFNPLCSYECT